MLSSLKPKTWKWTQALSRARVRREDFTGEVKTGPRSVGGGDVERPFQVRGAAGQMEEEENKLGVCWESEECDLTRAECLVGVGGFYLDKQEEAGDRLYPLAFAV